MGLGNSKTKKRKSTESTKPVVQGAVETHSQPRQRPKESRQDTVAASAKPLNAARTAPHHGAEEDGVRAVAIKTAFSRAHKGARRLLKGKTLAGSASDALLKILFDAHPHEVVGALRGLHVMSENYPVEIVGFLRCFVRFIDNAKAPHIGEDPLLLCHEAKTIMDSILASTMRDTAEKLRKLAALIPKITRNYFWPLALL